MLLLAGYITNVFTKSSGLVVMLAIGATNECLVTAA